jgi:hypothetical protein
LVRVTVTVVEEAVLSGCCVVKIDPKLPDVEVSAVSKWLTRAVWAASITMPTVTVEFLFIA